MNNNPSVDVATEEVKYLVFSLSRERYGFDILRVQEIIKVTNITRVPRAPDYIKGVINLRGKIIPVMDLRAKFGIASIPYDDKTCIIVVSGTRQSQPILIGIVVDTVVEVGNFNLSEIETAPNYGAVVDSTCIRGLGRRKDQGITVLLDLEKIVADAEPLDRDSR